MIETIPALAWTSLADGSNDFVNRRWLEYTGISLEETQRTGTTAPFHPEDIDEHLDKWRSALATGETFENEARVRRAADGEYRWFLIRSLPLRDERGNIVKWYGTMTDIEDRKRAEEALRKANADLAHITRLMTMSEFAASIAHEIKQPIAAAVTDANTCLRWLTRDHPDLQEACEAASRIIKDVTRAADIINRVRVLSKKGVPEHELVDVNEVIHEMMALLRHEATRYSISVRSDLGEKLPKIMADRVQLQQVLMNLMLNGIEAMKEVSPAGELRIKSEREEDGRLLISISDTGVGLPPDRADQIFNAFFTTKSQGTGMGLTISRSIIESHGGRLWVTANSGQGATFQFTLPTAVAAHA